MATLMYNKGQNELTYTVHTENKNHWLLNIFYELYVPQFHKTGLFSAFPHGPTQHNGGKGPPACESVSSPATQRKPEETSQTI